MEILNKLNMLLAQPLIWLVVLYQKTLSPDHGWFKYQFPHGFCKYHPTCSMYTKQSLEQSGLASLPKIIKRLLSCNPFSRGGIDLPHKHPHNT